MNNIEALFFTLSVGLFILVGTLIALLAKNNDKLISFSIGLSFSIMLSLSILELIPEAYELISSSLDLGMSILIILIFLILGIGILKILDVFIPDHDDKNGKSLKTKNLYHIGLISSIAIIIHNFVEGMAIYTSILSSSKLGFLVGIGVALHNIPLGMSITTFFYKDTKNIKKTILIISIIAISTFLGALVMYFYGSVNSFTFGILLTITLGMLLYITIFELLPQIRETKYKKETFLGIILGIIILAITIFIE